MKYTKISKLFLLTALFLLCLGLVACSDSDYSGATEGSTDTLSYNSGDGPSVSSEDQGEEYTETVEYDWDGCVITTDEVGYDPNQEWLDEDGYYTSEMDVATYIIEYKTLPSNFITKKEAKKKGWTGGDLDEYGEELCIGGDYFGNYEGLLPEVDGRSYYECDIDTMDAKKRGAKRIIYSDDGQIYYTDDHYESFTLIYGSDQ